MEQAAFKIQALFRAFFADHQYQLCRSRLIKLQAVYRRSRDQAKYKQTLARMLNLQAVYRGYAERKKYQLVRFLAVKLQAEYRRICAKRACEEIRNAAREFDNCNNASAADTRIPADASFAATCNVSVILLQTSPVPTPTLSPAFVASKRPSVRVTPNATVPTCDTHTLLIYSNGNRRPAKYVPLSLLLLLSAFVSLSPCLALSLSF